MYINRYVYVYIYICVYMYIYINLVYKPPYGPRCFGQWSWGLGGVCTPGA